MQHLNEFCTVNSTHCLMCVHQPLSHISVDRVHGVSIVDHTYLLEFKHPPREKCPDQVCQQPGGVIGKSFVLCGQMRRSSQIAPLMTFLLSLELLSIPKDNFPMMTKVSDPINFHLSENCGSN